MHDTCTSGSSKPALLPELESQAKKVKFSLGRLGDCWQTSTLSSTCTDIVSFLCRCTHCRSLPPQSIIMASKVQRISNDSATRLLQGEENMDAQESSDSSRRTLLLLSLGNIVLFGLTFTVWIWMTLTARDANQSYRDTSYYCGRQMVVNSLYSLTL